MKNFYDWMMEKLDVDSPIGDLANDMKCDKNFPFDGNKKDIERHLDRVGACDGAFRAFNKAWKEYENYLQEQEKEMECVEK